MLRRFFKSILKIIIILATLLLITGIIITRPTFDDNFPDLTRSQVDSNKLREHVIFLSQKSTPRNEHEITNLNTAANYIKNQLSNYTRQTSLQNFQVQGKQYKNVIAKFGPVSQKSIVIGAHYDAYSNFPGADDNASGVAGLIELGKLISDLELKTQVILVAYSLEEPPHFASTNMGSYKHALSLQNTDIQLMISLEMIGYFTNEPNSQDYPIPLLNLFYPSQGNFIAIVDLLMSNNATGLKSAINHFTDLPAYSINAPKNIAGIDFSDHRNYWEFGFPAIMVTDTAFYRNKAYHTQFDTYQRLNYDAMAKVVYGVFKYVESLAQITPKT